MLYLVVEVFIRGAYFPGRVTSRSPFSFLPATNKQAEMLEKWTVAFDVTLPLGVAQDIIEKVWDNTRIPCSDVWTRIVGRTHSTEDHISNEDFLSRLMQIVRGRNS